MRKGHRPSKPPSNRPRFWGRHAVSAALANPNRVCRKLWATREAAAALDIPNGLTVAFAEAPDLGRMVPSDAPHQGLVLEVDPLEDVWLGDLLADGAGDTAGIPLLAAILRRALPAGAVVVVQPLSSPKGPRHSFRERAANERWLERLEKVVQSALFSQAHVLKLVEENRDEFEW